ncbi:MAG TPA: gamma-glutamyltransferase [Gemmatimonadaceae bacterium]|nr:gamma-glutamyltransferase [Gemmatimonadaceae bacterium]
MRLPIRRFARFWLVVALTPSIVTAQAAKDSAGTVVSKRGLVISSSAIASDVGASILRRGGNAVDAAVATAFALAVTYPGAGNIGGGGFMVVRLKDGTATTIDYRERAPLRSTPAMYLDGSGKIDRSLTATGYLAPGVPGTVRGLALVHKKFGKLPWRDVVMPAARLASRGFALDSGLARSLTHEVAQAMKPYPASVAAYGKRGASGAQWEPGDTIVLRDLGRTLTAIATRGADVFYTGWIADSIAADMRRNGGLITKQDLAAYRARERAPVRGSYHGYDLVTMPPPSSGGVAMVEMLNILSHFDLQKAGRWSPETLHLVIEAMRRAYVDRARFLGDPDFVKMPLARLTSASYAATLASSIDRTKATSSTELGKDIVTPTGVATESDETTQFSIVDRDGNAVSNTFTLEGGYGSHVVVRGAGFLLNNEMGDFNKKPGETNVQGDIGTKANLIEPGKRMLSSMTPTIVTRKGKLFMVTGSPGGRTIINTVMEVVLNATGFGMNARQAVDAPRLHHQWLPDVAMFERDAISDSTVAQLRAMGHTVEQRGRQGDAHTIMYNPKTKTAYGANDRRSSDSKTSAP